MKEQDGLFQHIEEYSEEKLREEIVFCNKLLNTLPTNDIGIRHWRRLYELMVDRLSGMTSVSEED